MKKFYLYSLLTSLLLLCSNVASAHDFEVNGVYYTIASSSAKTVAVTYSGSYPDTVADEYSGIVTIPSTVTYNNVTYIVEGIGMSAFRGCTGVILVNISEGVKIIGESAFRDCSALASVTIPNSVTSIGTSAFYECSSLAKLNIPSSITSIGYSAFDNCTSLKRINITDLSAWCKIDFGDIGIVRSLTRFDLYLNGEKVTNLVIPSDITEIKKNTFQYCSGFTSIEIHNSVTSIGSGAFKYCSDLTNITIPESVTSIGGRAFYGCTGLTSVTIPNRVTSIGERAFYDCSGLTSVTIPNSVTTIGESAFYGCTSLTAVHITDLSAWCKINFVTYASANPLYDGANLYLNGEKVTNLVIPSDITEIKKYAFYGCSGLTDITFHDNVMLINQYAFKGCSGLRNVTIGSGVMVLGANAFETCSNLKCVTIPNSVISIGDNAFYGCSNLYTVIDYSDLGITKGSTDNGYVGYYATNIYTSGDDIPQDYIFETIDGVNTLVAYFGKSNDVVLPSNYNGGNYAIGDSVFYNSSITSIKIPNSVTTIGNSAFSGCTGLTSVTIPNSVTTIGNSAFDNCSGLTSITIPNSVTSIGNYAFLGCTGLTSVTIPNSVTSIGNCTFYGCTGLTSITIPNSVTTIGINAFYNCPLEKVEINTTTIGTWFSRLTSIKEIIIGDSVTSIGSGAFQYCSGLTNVTIPNSVKSIGNSAFYNCPLEKVEINTTTIDTWFRGHTSIKEIIIGNSVTSIGSSAFRDCSGLESVTVDSGNTVYDSREGCNAIIETATNTLIQGCKNTIIPNSVTSIGSSAFYGCTGLTNVTIPNSVTSIGSSAFYDCSGLTSITIPNSVTSIDYAFYGCTGLEKVEINTTIIYSWFGGITSIKEIIIGDSVTSIGSSAFYGCTGLTNVTIPNSVTSIGNSAFYDCTGITEIYIEATIPPSVSSGAFYNVPVSIPVYVPAGSKTAYQAANTWKSFTNIVEIPGGICGDDATWILRDSTLTISGSGAMYNYTDSVAPWSTYRLEIKEVVVNDSVTTIGSNAFFSCTGLTSITIPNSVTTIGESAFFRCTGLTSVTIGSGVTSIGENAFERCTGLTSVTIPNSVTSIGDYAFNGCTGIKNVRIEDGDTKLNLGKNGFKGLFYYCPLESLYLGRNLNYSEYYGDGYSPFAQITTLTSVTIGDNVNSLNTFLFKDCSNLNAITIPESVQIIGGYVFQYCDLREIHIPAGVTIIGGYAFSHNNNLEKITAAKENTRYSTPEGYNVLIDNNTIPGLATGIDGSTLVLGGKGAIIPDGIVSIGDGAFNGIHGITSITIPASVEAIGSYAFEACSDLKEIHCLATDRYISVSNFAFDGLYETTTLYIPAAGKKYYTGSWADFANIVVVGEIVVDGLSYAVISEEEKTVQVIDYSGSNEVVNIPSSITYNGEIYKVTAICYQAFKDYTNISGITIPASVSSIGYDAFAGCTNLASIKVESGNPVFDSRENCNAIIETATNTLIQGCKNTIIPNSVTSIGDYAFYNCDGLTSITIPNSVTTIGESAFLGCDGLTSVTIPNSVTSIENGAFKACTGLTSITIPNSVTWIGYHAFSGCTGLTSITIPNSVTSIRDWAFDNCTSLTSVTIPNSVTSIGYRAFYGCDGLTIITIPNSVTSIEDYAFYECTNLATVVNNSSLDIIAGSEDHGHVAYYADEVINNRGGSVIGDFVFNDSGNLIKYIGNESEITLPEKSPAGIKYGIVEAFQNNTKITSVIIPDSVSFIYNTFSGCTSLTSVTIGNGVHRIGEAAFQGCSALKDIYVNGIVPALLYSESFAEHYASATLHVPAGTKAAYQSSTSQREEMEIKMQPVYNNDLLASMSGCDKDAIYETVKVEAQNPDVAGTLNGNDYLLAYQPTKQKMTDLPKATFETNIVHGGRYKIALVTVPWFIESYKDTLISKITDPLYADSYLRVRVNQNNEQLAMFPCDSFNIGTSKTNFGVWEKHAIVPDRSRIDTIFLKDANNEDYIFDFVNGHSVGVNIELLRPLQYNERNGRYAAKNANNFAFRFLLDQIMLIPVDESTIVSTIYWKNFNNIVEEANDLTGDVDGDGVIDVADATTLVSMILDNSLATDAADVDGDGTVDVADVTSLVSIILGTRTANDAPAKAAATRAGELSTVSADGDGETLLINIDNPEYPFSAIQFDLELPEGIEVDFDGEYYAVDLGSRTNSRKHSYPECAIQPDGSLRVVIISMSNALYNGTTGDVATATLKVNGATDGDYQFTIKNVVLSAPGSKEKLAPYTGWINVTGGVTGISDIKEERAESNDIYDLQGRKVTEPVKGGIYIQNGKKVIW